MFKKIQSYSMFRLSIYMLIFSIMTSGCEKFNVINDIEIEFTTTTIVEGQSFVQQVLGGMGFDQFSEFDLSTSQKFQDEVGDVSRVVGANLEEFVLSTTDPNQSIDFLNSVSFSISFGDEAPALLAHSTDFPQGATSVSLTVSKNLDLTEYIKSQNMTITADVNGSQPLDDTEIQVDLLFLIDAKIVK